MYGKPFNFKRDFGTVQGAPGVAYDQDGQLFNFQHEPVDIEGRLMLVDPENAPAAPASVATETATAPSAPIVSDTSSEDDVPADEKPFDLLAWAQGEPSLAKTPWEKVKAETARLVDDMTGITGKEAARKAILAHYGL